MKQQIDRKIIVSKIISAAKLYKQNLVGKTFLYIFDNRYIEVMFRKNDFKHLTGVDSNLSANDFYKLAINNQLQAPQIFFSSRHPYKLAQKKLIHLNDISNLAMGENFILEEVSTQTETYKFGSTDLKFTICFNKDPNARSNNDYCYIAQSLRDDDCFLKSKNVFAVTHIFSKKNDTKKYSHEHYCEKGYSISDLPDEIIDLLSDELIRNCT